MVREQWEYSLRDAARICGVSTDTIKRRLKAGDLPHARRLNDAAGTWVVPLADLAAAGFTIKARAPRKRPQQITAAPAGTTALRSTDPVRLAVAEALSEVHRHYAHAFADLAAQLVRAREASSDPTPTGPTPTGGAPCDATAPRQSMTRPPGTVTD